MMPNDAPELPGWTMVADAAERLGVSRQYLYRLVGEGRFETLHRLGSKPTFFLAESEIEKFVTDRSAVVDEVVVEPPKPKKAKAAKKTAAKPKRKAAAKS